MKPIAASTRRLASSGSSALGDALAGRRHGAEEDPAERLHHRPRRAPSGRPTSTDADDVEDDRERRALLLLAEPLVAQHRRALLDDHPAVASGPGRRRGTPGARRCDFSHGSRTPLTRGRDLARRVGLDPLEDGLEQRLLAGEVVVERALGDPRARRRSRRARWRRTLLAELLLGDVDQSALGGGGVLRPSGRAGEVGTLGSRRLAADLLIPRSLDRTAVLGGVTGGRGHSRAWLAYRSLVAYCEYVPTVCESERKELAHDLGSLSPPWRSAPHRDRRGRRPS